VRNRESTDNEMIADRLLGIAAAGKPNHRGSSDPLMTNPAMGFYRCFSDEDIESERIEAVSS
jgi:hypothetical protein